MKSALSILKYIQSCSKLNVLQIFEKKFQKGKFGYIFFGENYES